ncbi:FecCD family ABC transporter permease [Robertmurraya kyonggiensis]|uniref:Iron ABC transporter permease n=1 Tax=Robertmurraya kyonggiensis TaxID=1037680 RepID=A0A4U1D358_9BACI|nr:iron ABC transporter permease [Robertmurraya kyonggiensis]TKC16772.1 iron ABC transporter permease [Robertmurraya kyonggiensis]
MTKTNINDSEKIYSKPFTAFFIIIAGCVALVFGLALSISVGAADIDLRTVWQAVFQFNPDKAGHTVIQDIRLPRSLACVLVGACFSVAGALMQGMTRNPLADSGLLGINAGSIFMVALCFAFFPGISYNTLILFSFIGAGLSLALIYGVGSLAKNGLTPVRLVLAGSAVGAMLTALSEGIAIYFNLSQDLAFWYAGGVAGIQWLQIKYMFPWIIAGLIGAMVLSPSITVLSLGEEIATGLGQRTKLVKLASVLVVLILAGSAVSAVGPIGFVGLLIPHLTRYLVGVDYRYIIPCSAILGGLFMTIADIGARMINPPYETPIGFIFALIGVPFFLYVARNERRAF